MNNSLRAALSPRKSSSEKQYVCHPADIAFNLRALLSE